MRASQQIIGLPIISSEEGSEHGVVKELLIDVQQRRLRFLVIADERWYFGAKAVAMDDVLSIGDDVIVVANQKVIKPFADVEEAVQMIREPIPILHQKVIAQSGKMIGTISEYFVDEVTGRLMGCRIESTAEGMENNFVPDENIAAYGPKAIVAVLPGKQNANAEPREDTAARYDILLTKSPEDKSQNTASSNNPFIERQKKFLIGRRCTKDIVDGNGGFLVKEGMLLDEETVEKVFKAGKLVELTMNSKP